MDFSIKVDGLDKIGKASSRVQKTVTAEIEKALLVSALRVESDAKQSILSGQKTGRIYRRGSIVHRASAPGEAPASDTGRLVNSISSFLQKGALYSLVVAGRGAVRYARMLEFGTVNMDARPFMLPALERNRRWIERRVKKAFEDGIRKSKK